MRIIYIAGKYADISRKAEDANTEKARRAAIALWEAGFFAFCPHTNTIRFHDDCKCTWEDYLKGDLAFLARCDAVLMLDNWLTSKGAKVEHREAMRLKLPIFYNIKEAVAWKVKHSKD